MPWSTFQRPIDHRFAIFAQGTGPLLEAFGMSWKALGQPWLALGDPWMASGRQAQVKPKETHGKEAGAWKPFGRSRDALQASWDARGRSWNALGSPGKVLERPWKPLHGLARSGGRGRGRGRGRGWKPSTLGVAGGAAAQPEPPPLRLPLSGSRGQEGFPACLCGLWPVGGSDSGELSCVPLHHLVLAAPGRGVAELLAHSQPMGSANTR